MMHRSTPPGRYDRRHVGWLAFCTLICLGAAAEAEQEKRNLALVASPAASYVSGDTSLAALQDGSQPRSSRDRRRGALGNWPRRGTQWVEYSWPRPIRTDRVEVYWWDDQQGVRAPAACRLLYATGTAWQPVPQAQLGVAKDQFNAATFPAIVTRRLRLEIEAAEDFSSGVLEWRVLDAGGSPRLPPVVQAGVDRTVMLGGATHLRGHVRSAEPSGEVPLAWSVRAGPGEVTFADAHAARTTATFSAPGTYQLQLTAGVYESRASSQLQVEVQPPPDGQPLDDVWPRPFGISHPLWQPRLKSLIVHWIPYCCQQISDPDLREGGINNFLEAAKKLAGEPAAPHRGYWFSNAWVHNTVESICLALMLDAQGDPELLAAQQRLREVLESWIPAILAAQEPDGYLHTHQTLSGLERWTHRPHHEGYTAGYFLEAAIAHHILTQGADTRLYDAARRLADCWCAHLGPPPKRAWYDGHQAMEMALVRFGRYVNRVETKGAGDQYIALAKFLLDSRRDGEEYDQSHVPVVEQYEAVGHAVRAAYSYAGMADIALERSDRDYQSAIQSLCDNIVHKKYYLTGGIGSGETSEGFGPDYSLRHDGYCESCSSCGLLFFLHRMNRWHGDARYADLYEQTLYNALLGSVDLAGQNFYYQNPLDSRRPRHPWHGCPCCVGNIPRTLLMLPSWIYLTDAQSVYVNLFVGSSIRLDHVAGGALHIRQITDYPWDGKVTLEVTPDAPRRFRLALRSPRRDVSQLYVSTPEADGIVAVAVNDQPADPVLEKGYLILDRTWHPGDRVQLELPLRVQRVRADQRVQAARGQVALRYGPLIYSLESLDQELSGQQLAQEAELASAWQPDLLGGVVTIRGPFSQGAPLLAIPYYARHNRGSTRVRNVVWFEEATGDARKSAPEVAPRRRSGTASSK